MAIEFKGGETYVTIDGVRYYTKPHNHDEGFDSVELTQVPRWKESELSGDEYRWNNRATVYRKGQVVGVEMDITMFGALIKLLPVLDQLRNWGYLGVDECAQPGCTDEPDVLLRLKEHWDVTGQLKAVEMSHVRPFCNAHLHRGDCSMDDSDNNYERLGMRVDGAWVPYPDLDVLA